MTARHLLVTITLVVTGAQLTARAQPGAPRTPAESDFAAQLEELKANLDASGPLARLLEVARTLRPEQRASYRSMVSGLITSLVAQARDGGAWPSRAIGQLDAARRLGKTFGVALPEGTPRLRRELKSARTSRSRGFREERLQELRASVASVRRRVASGGFEDVRRWADSMLGRGSYHVGQIDEFVAEHPTGRKTRPAFLATMERQVKRVEPVAQLKEAQKLYSTVLREEWPKSSPKGGPLRRAWEHLDLAAGLYPGTGKAPPKKLAALRSRVERLASRIILKVSAHQLRESRDKAREAMAGAGHHLEAARAQLKGSDPLAAESSAKLAQGLLEVARDHYHDAAAGHARLDHFNADRATATRAQLTFQPEPALQASMRVPQRLTRMEGAAARLLGRVNAPLGRRPPGDRKTP